MKVKLKIYRLVTEIIFDRIEAGTYMIASALIGKKVIIDKIDPNIIKSEINILKKMGIKIKKKSTQSQFKKIKT